MAILTSSRAQLISDAYHGEGGFSTGTYIDRFRSEGDDDYVARQSIAVYDNMFKPACARYAGYLARHPATRTTDNPLLIAMMSSIDRDNTSVQTWMINFAKNAKAFGSAIGVVDMPDADIPASQASQIEQGIIPYFATIAMNHVTDYSVNTSGHIDYLQIKRYEYIDNKRVLVTREWDSELIKMMVGSSVVFERETIGGICPVVDFSEGDFPEDGEFSGVADLQRELYNRYSEGKQIIRDQTFSVFTYQVPAEYWSIVDTAEVAEAIGTKRAVKYIGDNQPGYAAPDVGPSNTISSDRNELKDRIREITHTVEKDSAIPESGVSRAIKFQDLNGSLSSYAGNLEKFERRMWNVACKMLNIDPDEISVDWPREYKVIDIDSELDAIDRMISLGFPESSIEEKKRRVLSSIFTSTDSDLAERIESELIENRQAGA